MFHSQVLKYRSIAATAIFLVSIAALGVISPQILAAEMRIIPDKKVDERLFLLTLLESMYTTWPTDTSDQNEFVAAATEHRATAIRMREHCRRENLGADLEGCFDEYVQSLDAYTDFLLNLGHIRKETAEQVQKDELSSGFNAGLAGSATYGAMSGSDYSGGEAAAAALMTGIAQYLLDSWEKADKRDAVAQQRMEALARRLDDRIAASRANAQAVARKLAKENGWGKSEAGFENDPQLTAHIQKMIEQNDLQGLLRVYEKVTKDHPRDPFLRLDHNVLRATADAGNPAALLRDAQDSLDTASLIPEGHIYDEYRTMCVIQAALLASNARSTEIMNGITPTGSTAASQFLIRCIDWVIENTPSDLTGELGEFRAGALLADGQVDEALEQANEVLEQRQHDAAFCYNYACILSRMNSTDKALGWLNAAIDRGYTNLIQIKSDPDLDNLRRKQAKGYAEAVSIDWEWNIAWGVFNDDIIMTNKSRFPLTGVIFTADLEQDGKRWRPQMTAEVIMPGETYKWENIVSIPKGRLSKGTANMVCDQNR